VAAELCALSGAWNFRDVADTTGALRPGRLFRSSELTGLDDDDRRTLLALGVTDVADLRSHREVERRGPGRVPGGVDVHLLPIPDPAVDGAPAGNEAPHEHAFQRLMTEKSDDESLLEAAARYMTEEYRRFPTLGGTRRALRRVVSLLQGGHAVLTHCFAGKDRTGFLVALVLETVGLDREAILADYLHSNAAAAQLRSRVLELIRQRADGELSDETAALTEARLSDEVLGVRGEYLDVARRAIDESCGSLDAYLREAGITEADVDRLCDVLRG
jgi:protein-tyrosine phosphatase